MTGTVVSLASFVNLVGAVSSLIDIASSHSLKVQLTISFQTAFWIVNAGVKVSSKRQIIRTGWRF